MTEIATYRTYTVRIEKPSRATDFELTQYIKDACSHWCQNLMPPGAYPDAPHDPGDAMYNPGPLAVSVIRND